MRNLLILCLVSTLTMGCNNLYRSNYTSVTLSKPVAEYLNQQTLTVHNNKPNPTIRKAQVIEPYLDTNYRLQYRRLAGTNLILEVIDSQGNRRNIAIPQTKLTAFPIAFTTTIAPIVVTKLLQYDDPDAYYDYTSEVAVGVTILSALTDALFVPATKLAARNRQFAVPKTFVLNNLDQVQTLDTSNPKLYTIAQPINPNITPYLDANWQKHTRVFLGAYAGYGLVHHSTSVIPATKLKPSNWYSVALSLQSRPNLRWGVRYDWSKTPEFQTNATSMQLAYVSNETPNAKLIYGLGAGFGSFTRIASNNFTTIVDILNNRKLGNDSSVVTVNTFIPGQTHYFLPFSVFIQYEAAITKNINVTLGVRMASVSSITSFNSQDYLRTNEVIAPGITAERQQNINYPRTITLNSKNMSFQGNIGLNFLITK
jgi:hypothetical protein